MKLCEKCGDCDAERVRLIGGRHIDLCAPCVSAWNRVALCADAYRHVTERAFYRTGSRTDAEESARKYVDAEIALFDLSESWLNTTKEEVDDE